MTKTTSCPVCGKPTQQATRPFCSQRCADIDLGRWFTGQYRIPGPPVDEENMEKDERNDER
ncbi:DNA gyrase inhibitor YacG [Acetobacter senegalensis]|uniref:DNA gyrase inhibitor YacG n=1 Tax=Acetobacter senegalensis TaxID=446692 RepID=UPI001EDC6192|nr:DNA gyrase inhibitor YacG [Acetobacter senegalensis]MCG4259742.1 DNA gyrase inhibitor YacG [Acetobacter senegalensis]